MNAAGGTSEYTVEGTTFSPEGIIRDANGNPHKLISPIVRTAEIATLCNDSKIVYNAEKGSFQNIGEPTEAALKVLVEKIGSTSTKITASLPSLDPQRRSSAVSDQYESDFKRLLTFEFSRDRKMMSVLTQRKDGKGFLFAKGAPESILDQCTKAEIDGSVVPLTAAIKQAIQERFVAYSRDGLRTLALAYIAKEDVHPSHYSSESAADYGRFEQDLIFVSLVGMLDPPRPEVRDAVAQCKAAGIRVICITGDNKGTAEAICRQIGLLGPNEDTTGKSYTGREFDALSLEQKIEAVRSAKIFSRTEPSHKSQLVDLLQQLGFVVAMVGVLR